MIPFRTVTAEDAKLFSVYLAGQPFRSCEFTAGAIFQWRAYFDTKFAIVHGMLVLQPTYPLEGVCFSYPVGPGERGAALDEIERDAAERGLPLQFCCVPETELAVFSARYGARAKHASHRDWADYLYEADNLKLFPGKRYHGQRNHLSRFTRENPDYRFVPVTRENLPGAEAFLNEYEKHAPIDKAIEAEEMLRAKELLHWTPCLGMTAGYIETDGVIVALAVGEVVSDTLYVHVEKARLDYPGAYQAIVSAFARAACREDTRFINREDDSGEEGLRRSKLSYGPVRLVDKYWVTVENKEATSI